MREDVTGDFVRLCSGNLRSLYLLSLYNRYDWFLGNSLSPVIQKIQLLNKKYGKD
jgi:hypothetical protein